MIITEDLVAGNPHFPGGMLMGNERKLEEMLRMVVMATAFACSSLRQMGNGHLGRVKRPSSVYGSSYKITQ